ncbi:hypothetical protein SCHPADRAFT_906366 [Schizopora paradoxa]|uniref:Uncharacterized protein n=1 Tax=Schizopora paradoxa TaxID=27342 RepID=A0A0H2RGU9_9AGAM|nr:hypothetical protein SCHPADRAFT_906366 [Schizopora paradoxa]
MLRILWLDIAACIIGSLDMINASFWRCYSNQRFRAAGCPTSRSLQTDYPIQILKSSAYRFSFQDIAIRLVNFLQDSLGSCPTNVIPIQ